MIRETQVDIKSMMKTLEKVSGIDMILEEIPDT